MAVFLPRIAQPVSELRVVWTPDGFDIVEVVIGEIPITQVHPAS